MLRKTLLLSCVPLVGGLAYAWSQELIPGTNGALAAIWSRNPGFTGIDLPTAVRPKRSSPADTAEDEVLPQLTGIPAAGLEEVFRFDVRPAWVTSRWSRVSTVLSERQLQGLRVPLVTGTDLDDLAGSLTFYFDHQRQLRRLAFSGRTGEPRRLVALLTERFGFQTVPDLGAGLYLVRWNGIPMSALRVAHAPVIRSADPLSHFEIELEINRPDTGYRLSPRLEKILLQDRALYRWQ